MRARTAIYVHWARDAAEHNRIVHGILRDHGAKTLIKSKSMLTEECGFRPYMASVGIEVIETDLGERIQQLDNEDTEPRRRACRAQAARRRGGGVLPHDGHRTWQQRRALPRRSAAPKRRAR